MISAEKTFINTVACTVALAGSYKIRVSLNTRAINLKLSGKIASKNKRNCYLCSKSEGYNIDRIVATSQLLHNDSVFSRITVTYSTFT